MSTYSRTVHWIVWGFLMLVLVAIGAAYMLSVRQLGPRLPVIGPVADFALTNQLGEAVSLEALTGQVWVADIIFTRCPGPCADMTRRMSELQAAVPEHLPVKFISLTTDPDFDQPAILKTYGERFGAAFTRWQFFTGTKKAIAALAIDSLKLTAVEKQPAERDGENDLFIHSTVFVVVDKHGRLRGTFETVKAEGEEKLDPQWKGKLLAAVTRLSKER